MFLNGCPLCGYSAPPVSPSKSKKAPKAKAGRAKTSRGTEPLPAFAYIASTIVLLALIALLSYFITR